MFKVPKLKEAEVMLKEGEKLNPGPWVQHSIYTAEAARLIAEGVSNMDSETAYILGMLHDIGRRVGVFSMRHAIDGYNYAKEKGYDFLGQICITHSFPYQNINAVFGKWDCSEEEFKFVSNFLNNIKYTEYDKLIQLCDGLALPNGYVLMEKRLMDVALRHGVNEFTIRKWNSIFEIKDYFEHKIGKSIYTLLPGVVDNTFQL